MTEFRPFDYKNCTAVVTGATSGIGKAIALRLVAAGARVCMVGRSVKSPELLTRESGDCAKQIKYYQADLAIDDDIHRLAHSLQHDEPGVDILVHSAGIIKYGLVESAAIEDFDLQYRCNVRAPYLLTQAMLPVLKKRQGQIVFINSSIISNIRPRVAQYSATQHALKAIADGLRHEINADGVRVLSVFPGRTATPRQAAIFSLEDRIYQPELLLQPENIAEIVVSALSLPRTAEVTDLHLRPLIKSY